MRRGSINCAAHRFLDRSPAVRDRVVDFGCVQIGVIEAHATSDQDLAGRQQRGCKNMKYAAKGAFGSGRVNQPPNPSIGQSELNLALKSDRARA